MEDLSIYILTSTLIMILADAICGYSCFKTLFTTMSFWKMTCYTSMHPHPERIALKKEILKLF